jgi:AraC-like DNA-binding protein
MPGQELSRPGETTGSIGQRVQKYVDANLMERMTLESVARANFTSRARLAREFREHTGETFGTYLLRRRLERAQHLLITTPSSIKVIAWRAGFSDPDYFGAAFRRAVGCTPTAFRKKRR